LASSLASVSERSKRLLAQRVRVCGKFARNLPVQKSRFETFFAIFAH
jgi:hypothetical protein